MAADEVAGDLFAEGKAAALTEHGAHLYVGDHVADMVAARTAGVPGLGVATGPCTARRAARRRRHAGSVAISERIPSGAGPGLWSG